MSGVDFLHVKEWHPLYRYSVIHPFFTLNANTLLFTWIALGILVLIALSIRPILRRKNSRIRYLLLQAIRSFISLTTQTINTFSFGHIAFVSSIFIFIFLCNTIAIFPWVEEATKDLNTTIAMGLIAFFYIQAYTIKAHGIKEYIKEYFTPIFIMFPLHIVSKISTIVSMSFRLFGNIFGSSIILHIYSAVLEQFIAFQLVGLLGFNLVMTFFFVIFEGFLQAFVFTMLTVTYLSIGLAHEGEEETGHAHE